MGDKKPVPGFMVLTPDKRLVVVGRKYRSKWWRVTCVCPQSRRRKDGSCKHEREVLDFLKPEIRERARIVQRTEEQ